MSTPRIRVPRTAKPGETLEIRTMLPHDMESGQRVGPDGETIPRHIIRTFIARYDGEEVFRADLHPAIAANPFITFHVKARDSGTLSFEWIDDDGEVVTAEAPLTVRS